MKDGSEAFRILLENQPDTLNKAVVSALQKIEGAAAAIRTEDEKNGRKRIVADELKPMSEKLPYAISEARRQTIAAIDSRLAAARDTWQRRRDRRPDADLLNLRRAENQVNGMSDAQIKDLVMTYSDGELVLDTYEINAVRARLRSIDADQLDLFNELVKQRRGDAPWIGESDELAELADYRALISTLKDDELILVDEAAAEDPSVPAQFSRIKVKASDLVDYDDVLGQPVT